MYVKNREAHKFSSHVPIRNLWRNYSPKKFPKFMRVSSKLSVLPVIQAHVPKSLFILMIARSTRLGRVWVCADLAYRPLSMNSKANVSILFHILKIWDHLSSIHCNPPTSPRSLSMKPTVKSKLLFPKISSHLRLDDAGKMFASPANSRVGRWIF